jgi:hypothetical protein
MLPPIIGSSAYHLNALSIHFLLLLVLTHNPVPKGRRIIMKVMSSRNSRTVNLLLVNILGVHDTFNVVVGVPDAPEDVTTKWERNDEHEP